MACLGITKNTALETKEPVNFRIESEGKIVDSNSPSVKLI